MGNHVMSLWRVRGRTAAAVIVLVAALAAVVPASAQPTTDRIGGVNRFDTAALVSRELKSCLVAVANGQSFPDGLAGALLGRPILLTEPNHVPEETATELDRLVNECVINPGGLGKIIVLGGSAAVSEDVFDELATYSNFGAVRLAGADRYKTAIAIAEHAGVGPTAIMATGENFPDALAAGPIAAAFDWPILLNSGDSLRAEVAGFLADHSIQSVFIIGGQAGVPDSIVDELAAMNISSARFAGPDRYATAAVVANWALPKLPGNTCALLVNGTTFPDALAAGPLGGRFGCPIALVQQNSLPEPTELVLEAWAPAFDDITAIGGTGVVSEGVLADAAAAATP